MCVHIAFGSALERRCCHYNCIHKVSQWSHVTHALNTMQSCRIQPLFFDSLSDTASLPPHGRYRSILSERFNVGLGRQIFMVMPLLPFMSTSGSLALAAKISSLPVPPVTSVTWISFSKTSSRNTRCRSLPLHMIANTGRCYPRLVQPSMFFYTKCCSWPYPCDLKKKLRPALRCYTHVSQAQRQIDSCTPGVRSTGVHLPRGTRAESRRIDE